MSTSPLGSFPIFFVNFWSIEVRILVHSLTLLSVCFCTTGPVRLYVQVQTSSTLVLSDIPGCMTVAHQQRALNIFFPSGNNEYATNLIIANIETLSESRSTTATLAT